MTVRNRATEWIPALIVFALGIAAWQASIEAFHIQKFLLPKPWAIVSAFWTQRSVLWSAGWVTLKEALGGFVIGSTFGMFVAALLARFRRLGDALMPLAIAANAIPIIAFSPIFNAWFDPLSPAPRMATAAVLCFFPVMVNTLRGLTSVRPAQIDLMRSYAAGEFQIFRRVRVPTALPFIFAALKVATVLAMIGAIVSDYFGTFGSLGITIKNSVSQVAVFLFPLLVLCSLPFAHALTFSIAPVFIVALLLTAIAVWQITGDGEATLFEGVALVALYVILAAVTMYE